MKSAPASPVSFQALQPGILRYVKVAGRVIKVCLSFNPDFYHHDFQQRQRERRTSTEAYPFEDLLPLPKLRLISQRPVIRCRNADQIAKADDQTVNKHCEGSAMSEAPYRQSPPCRVSITRRPRSWNYHYTS